MKISKHDIRHEELNGLIFMIKRDRTRMTLLPLVREIFAAMHDAVVYTDKKLKLLEEI